RFPGDLVDRKRSGNHITREAQAVSGQLFFFAVALPPLRPAALCCAVVPPCLALPPEPLFFPPCSDDFGLFAIRAARSFDMPLSLSASYCFSFFTLARVAMTVPPIPLPAARAAGAAPRRGRSRRSRGSRCSARGRPSATRAPRRRRPPRRDGRRQRAARRPSRTRSSRASTRGEPAS